MFRSMKQGPHEMMECHVGMLVQCAATSVLSNHLGEKRKLMFIEHYVSILRFRQHNFILLAMYGFF